MVFPMNVQLDHRAVFRNQMAVPRFNVVRAGAFQPRFYRYRSRARRFTCRRKPAAGCHSNVWLFVAMCRPDVVKSARGHGLRAFFLIFRCNGGLISVKVQSTPERSRTPTGTDPARFQQHMRCHTFCYRTISVLSNHSCKNTLLRHAKNCRCKVTTSDFRVTNFQRRFGMQQLDPDP